jgi:hypothetical protein
LPTTTNDGDDDVAGYDVVDDEVGVDAAGNNDALLALLASV